MPFRVTGTAVIAIALACAGGEGPSEPANPPAAAVISSGADQVRFPGTPLRSVFVVQVVDAAGDPTAVGGLPVVWRVTEGGGEVSGADTTDALGIARAGFVLGDEGTHSVEVVVADLEPVHVSARAVHPGPILFVSNRRAGFTGDAVAGFPGDLYVVNDDGSDVILLELSNLPLEYTAHPTWKVDGTEILFNRVEPRPAGGTPGAVPLGVFAAYPTADDRRKIPVGSEPAYAVNLREARWSPDGRTIVAHRSDTERLYTFGPSGTDFSEVATPPGSARSADWSPAGDRFVYACGGNICVADRDGGKSVRLTNTGRDGEPVWSPDGTQILFARDTSGSGGIWLMGADGSDARRVLDGAASSPAWAPDGTRFAASVKNDEGADIWVTDVVTGESVNLTESRWIDREPSWRRNAPLAADMRAAVMPSTVRSN